LTIRLVETPMNKTLIALRATLFLLAVSIFAPALTGCNPPTAPAENGDASSKAPDTMTPGTTPASPGTPAGPNANSLKIEGSNTLLPLAQEWAKAFGTKKPEANIPVAGGGSGQGITALINGTTDIANASRPAKDEEKAEAKAKGFELFETAVARDGITIVVNPANPVKTLTMDQIKGIYTGKINNWKEIGGADEKIICSGRDSSSGTYEYFMEDVLKKEKYRADMISTPSNNAIAKNVETQKGGIGYIGVAYATEFTKSGKVKEVPVSFKEGEPGLLPTEDNVLSGKYPISRALFNYTKNKPDGLAKEYLDFVTGPEGQDLVKKVGYIPLKK
jgi:phosphate transport system substrate-binding protein